MTFSQTLSITNTQRDSIVSKIMRGNKAESENFILKNSLVTKDSVIAIQSNIIGVLKVDLQLQQDINTNLQSVIDNQTTIIINHKKIARKKRFYTFLKGAAVGGAIITLITIL